MIKYDVFLIMIENYQILSVMLIFRRFFEDPQDPGQPRSAFFARISLDGMGSKNEGVFKDIAIKKAEDGTYVRSDLQGDPYRRTSSALLTIRELVEKVKEHYKQNH